MQDSFIIISMLVGYLIILIGIGFWGSKESDDMTGYFVAGKKLPSWVIAFSSNATGESGWLLLGLTGMAYMVGFHALWVSLGEVLGVAFAWIFVARPFKEYTDRYNSITVADFLTDRVKDRSNLIRIISTVVILTMVTAYVTAQFQASGKAFSRFLGMDHVWGVVLGTVIVIFYTFIGGFKAVAYSDLLQGVLMFFGLLLLPIIGISACGGWSAMLTQLHAIDPGLLLAMGTENVGPKQIIGTLSLVGIGLGFLASPQLLPRFISARDQKQIVDGSVMAVVCIIVFDLGAVMTGISGRVLFDGLADQELVLPTMTMELLPPIFAGMFLVIVLSAILSSVDSLLIMASSSVVRDMVQQVFKMPLSDKKLGMLGRVTTALVGLIAFACALSEPKMIFWFVLFAWAGLATAFAPSVICCLFWKRTTRQGVIAGMLGGFLTSMFWVTYVKKELADKYVWAALEEMYPGFIVGFLLVIGVSLLTKAPEDAAEELDSIHNKIGPAFRKKT